MADLDAVGITNGLAGESGSAEIGGHDAAPQPTESAGGSGPDLQPPVIALVSPLTSGEIDSDTPIVIDVTDNTPPVIGLSVFVFFGDCAELVATDDGFATNYAGSSSAPIVDGNRYTLRRDGGWPSGAMRFDVRAYDAAGN